MKQYVYRLKEQTNEQVPNVNKQQYLEDQNSISCVEAETTKQRTKISRILFYF